MAKAPWWTRINPGFFRGENGPSPTSQAQTAVSRRMAGIAASVQLREHPEVATAYLRSNIPASIVRRTDMELRRQQELRAVEQHNRQGTQSTMTPQQREIAAVEQREKGLVLPEDQPFMPNMNDPLGLSSEINNTKPTDPATGKPVEREGPGLDIIGGALHGIGTAVNTVWSGNPLAVSLAAGESNPEVGNFWTGEGAEIGRPVRLVFGGSELSPAQKADMRRAGYDPESWVSRYAYYFRDLSAGQHAVSDRDVEVFNQQYNPRDVQAAREVITSDFLNDQNINGLTPETQQFVNRMSAGDAQANELFGKMNNAAFVSSTITGNIINTLGGAVGLDRGEEETKWAGLALEVVGTWKADPFVVGSNVARGARARRYGINPAAGSQAVLDKITATVDGRVDGDAAFRIGKVWNQDIIAPIDRVVRLNSDAATLAAKGDRAGAAVLENQAGVIAENFARRHPDLMPTWDLVIGTRTGNYQGVRVIDTSTDAGKAEMAARQQRLGVQGQTPFVPVTDAASRKPMWELDYVDGVATAESLNRSRAKLMDELSVFVWAEALASGAPLVRGQRLLPGEVALNRQLRTSAAFNAVRNWVTGGSGSLQAALGAGGLVRFTGDFTRLSDVVIAKGAGDYYKAEHVDRMSRQMERMHSRVAMSPSGHAIAPGEVIGSTETYRRLVAQFMPARLANIAVNRWALASPAEQVAQWRQTWEMIVEMQPGLTRTPEGRDLINLVTKSVAPTTPKQGQRMDGPREVYTIDEADNLILADGFELAAGLYPYQMNTGFVVPNIRALRQLGERREFISALAGRSWGQVHLLSSALRAVNSPGPAAAVGLWKVGKVANPANMTRQAVELAVTQVAERGLGHLWNIYRARRGVVLEHLESKVIANVEARAATRLEQAVGGTDELAGISAAYKIGDWQRYGDLMEAAGTRVGMAADELAALRRIAAEGTDYQILVRNVNPTRVGAARVLESVRRVRAFYYRGTGATIDDAARQSPHARWADEQYARDLQAANLGQLQGSIQNQLLLDRGVDDLAEVANRGFGGKMTRTPNSRQLLGTAGDAGAARWFREFDSRQWDELPGLVMRGVAHEATGGAGSAAARVNSQLGREAFPAGVNTAEEMAAHLITNNPAFRQQAMRLHYDTTGTRVSSPAQEAEAIERLAALWVRDLGQHLGLAVQERTGRLIAPLPEVRPLLEKVANGERATVDDLSRIPDDLRPAAVSDSLYVPLPPKGQTFREWAVNGGSKAYALFVARPLQRLMIEPVYVANRNLMYRNLEGPIDGLVGKGFTRGQAATVFEYATHRYAVNATFRGTDNVAERSMFAELTDNILMFNRAQEDFIRRFMRVTAANPAIVARAAMLTEAAQHAGMVYPQVEVDDDGRRQTHLVFVYPGSAVGAKAFQEVGQALGWGSDLNLIPLFSSMSSRVNFLNASLTRPVAFSATPLIGTPMRLVRDQFPETGSWITPTLAAIEGQNQETYFAEQNVIRQWLPAPIARLAPLITPNAADGQLASAIKNATIYYHAAGLLPGENATPDEIENANNAIRQMAMNQLLWRAATGFFLPAAPQYDEPQGLGLPDVSALTEAMGVDTLRGEWFDILRQETERHGLDGFAYAMTEWFRRYPRGESIVSPEAFTVGTTRAPGTAEDSGSFNSGEGIAQWMLDNRGWVEDNRTVAYYLLPGFAEPNFSPTGWRLQLSLGQREHKNQKEFEVDVAYAIAAREFFDQLDRRNAAMAAGTPDSVAYKDFELWEQGWRARNPRSAKEMDRRNDPNYVHAELAPALQRLVESGNAPAGVDLGMATRVWNHYSAYRDQYNQVNTSLKGNQFARQSLNADYRREGNSLFLNTPAQELWKAIDVYETE